MSIYIIVRTYDPHDRYEAAENSNVWAGTDKTAALDQCEYLQACDKYASYDIEHWVNGERDWQSVYRD